MLKPDPLKISPYTARPLGLTGGILYETPETSSVLDLSFQLLEEGKEFPPLSSVRADQQTKGRGRYGRAWVSPPGNIYASLRLPEHFPFQGTFAPLATAYFLTLGLEELFILKTMVKWPNDLIYQGKKVAGILLENRNGTIIAGIGINLGTPPAIPERLPEAPPVGALPLFDFNPSQMWERLAKHFHDSYNKFSKFGDTPTREKNFSRLAEKRLLGLGQRATLCTPETAPLTGTIRGLNPGGALVLDTPQGSQTVWSGTLTLS
ncbi:MAG: biotin--[acetyl-CoA-carboxylase] ligase [Deltaproteobacteria bacterium]|nr:biotin--[acetyl-CoA-carboxylase] ligase [Deltaproteobacteria bacterium]